MPKRFWFWIGLAAGVIVLDQLTKQIVLSVMQYGDTVYVAPFWNWVLTYNRGAAFSFLANQDGWQRWFFTVLALGVSGWIVTMLRKHAGETLLAFALSLIMGGALGNVIDRIRFGAVRGHDKRRQEQGLGIPNRISAARYQEPPGDALEAVQQQGSAVDGCGMLPGFHENHPAGFDTTRATPRAAKTIPAIMMGVRGSLNMRKAMMAVTGGTR